MCFKGEKTFSNLMEYCCVCSVKTHCENTSNIAEKNIKIASFATLLVHSFIQKLLTFSLLSVISEGKCCGVCSTSGENHFMFSFKLNGFVGDR